jgi:glycosyltransferase involved in cell wall biosynthesis
VNDISATDQAVPRVGVGLPVYNGGKYVAQAIEAILAQEFDDLELIIVDNASTDETSEICLAYAASDKRVHYHRNETNIGAAANFNRVVSLSRAPYFMWAANDDFYETEYISRCVAELDANPDVILCSSLVRIIDENGRQVAIYNSEIDDSKSKDAVKRLGAIIMCRHLCTDMFGLMRTEMLRKTELMNPYYGSDRSFLAEMALLGRFSKINEPLFNNREHPYRDSRLGIENKLVSGARLPQWKLYRHYRRAIQAHVADEEVHRECLGLLARWWFVDWNLARLGVNIIGSVWKSVYRIVNWLKIRIYGPLPQIERKQ